MKKMECLENGIQSSKRASSFSSSRIERSPFLHRPRSRFARFLLFEKVDYLQWVCTIAVFFFVVVLFQMYLPGSIMEKPGASSGVTRNEGWWDVKEIRELDFGDGIRFEPGRLLERFRKEGAPVNSSVPLVRSGEIRKPQLALVFADQTVEPQKLLMVSVATALLEIGYAIQVYSLKDGPAQIVWRSLGVPVIILSNINKAGIAVDWLNYDGILVNSIETKSIFSCFLQEPFKSLPVIWTIHERELAIRAREYSSNGKTQLIDDWKQAFNRASVVVFPNYFMPMMYSTFDAGNYFVIPGSPDQAWEANAFMVSNNWDGLRVKMGYEPDDFVIAVVGSEFSYSGLWLEHAFVLQALMQVFTDFPNNNNSTSRLKLCILRGNTSSNYTVAVESIALKLGYPKGSVQHIGIDGDVNEFLSISDLVIYGSFFEEQSFPEILVLAMCFGKPIVAPDLSMIKKYIEDRVNGLLFSRGKLEALTQVLLQAISGGKLSTLAEHVASNGKGSATNLMVSETIEGYSSLLANVLKFPSEVRTPKAVAEIPQRLREEWQWHLFSENVGSIFINRTDKIYRFLDDVEEKWNHSNTKSLEGSSAMDEAFSYTDWEEEKFIDSINARRRQEDDELKDRTDQPHGTWEEVYRNAKRIDRARNDLRERDDRELERTGQPLCIYEPYFGEGAWPFLHQTSLYRGIGLSTKGRRPGEDDVDAPSRLPLLNTHYYRDILGEYGAFFAIANRIDRIHKNAWIGFQSWRASARKASLSTFAESALLDAIQKRKHGDTFYFWVPMDKDPQSPSKWNFWTYCDSINAGNCRFAVSEALRKMYGIKRGLDTLPPMPADGSTWSVMHSWAMPTRSFLEFVMFSRMFVDAMDAQMYDEHHQSGHCYLSLYKDRQCYSRVLELLVNVWAYHSARRMIYMNPETGVMKEQHKLKDRRGHMWIKWFSYATLKSMDEDLAEEFDSDHPTRRWLWPSTGEVFWQGMYEREKNLRQRQKEKRKQQSKDKISRMRRRVRQKAIGKYVKPPPEDMMDLNSTRTRILLEK